MKILQVNVVYRKGSTGKIVSDLHTQLIQQHDESVVCYGRGNMISEPNIYKICGENYAKMNKVISALSGILYGGCRISTAKLIRRIRQEKPDLVHLHCLNGNFVNIYQLVAWLKKNHIKTVLTLHAEFMYTGGCSHSIDCEKWKLQSGCSHCPRMKDELSWILFDRTHEMWKRLYEAFSGFEENLIVVSVSPWLRDRAAQSSILHGFRHEVIYNGVDTDIFKPYDTEDLRSILNLTGEKVVFHATPKFDDSPDNIKGGRYVLELASRMQNVKFVIAGAHPDGLKVPSNVILLGQISDQKLLAQYYAMADVCLLTSQRETFSMVVAESLCCGTPVVGFQAGAPEQIALSEFSAFVPFGDMQRLEKALRLALNNKNLSEVIYQKASIPYGKATMFQCYYDLYKEVQMDDA